MSSRCYIRITNRKKYLALCQRGFASQGTEESKLINFTLIGAPGRSETIFFATLNIHKLIINFSSYTSINHSVERGHTA